MLLSGKSGKTSLVWTPDGLPINIKIKCNQSTEVYGPQYGFWNRAEIVRSSDV